MNFYIKIHILEMYQKLTSANICNLDKYMQIPIVRTISNGKNNSNVNNFQIVMIHIRSFGGIRYCE